MSNGFSGDESVSPVSACGSLVTSPTSPAPSASMGLSALPTPGMTVKTPWVTDETGTANGSGSARLSPWVRTRPSAVISMTRSLARELGPDSIGVTAIAPGILTTESTDYVPRARHDHYETGRAVPGPQPPEDIAGTVAFLLSEAALTLTGQVLPVNRGFVFT